MPKAGAGGGQKRRHSEKLDRSVKMKTENDDEANTSLKMSQCDLCEKFFSTKTNMLRHQKTIHSQSAAMKFEIKREYEMKHES